MAGRAGLAPRAARRVRHRRRVHARSRVAGVCAAQIRPDRREYRHQGARQAPRCAALSAVPRRLLMRVGIDFDNTIVGYDALFHRAAVEQGLVPPELSATKVAVRDHLRSIGREDEWTELQGHVYGPRMGEAAPFPGVLNFFRWARDLRLELTIVSHRTRHPFIGPKHDLHEAARGWVDTFLQRPEL